MARNDTNPANQSNHVVRVPANDCQADLTNLTLANSSEFGAKLIQFSAYNGSDTDVHLWIGGRFPNSAWVAGQWDTSDTNEEYQDDTVAAQGGAGSFDFGADNVDGDGILVAATRKFNTIVFSIDDDADDDLAVFILRYWTGSAWSTITAIHFVLSGTAAVGANTGGNVEYACIFSPPNDWATTDGSTAGTGEVDSRHDSATRSGKQDLYPIQIIATTSANVVASCDQVHVGFMRLAMWDVDTVVPVLSPHVPMWLCSKGEVPWGVWQLMDTTTTYLMNAVTERSNQVGIIGGSETGVP